MNQFLRESVRINSWFHIGNQEEEEKLYEDPVVLKTSLKVERREDLNENNKVIIGL